MLLTLDRLHWLRVSALSTGYWCEVLAYTPHDDRSFWLGSTNTPTPRLALRWLREWTKDVLDQLDAAAAWPAHEWLGDHAEHERALSSLTCGEMYSLSVREDTTRYILSARPTRSTP
ncbi:hypothetical protein ACEZDB_26045 [Streptacidiphilus sp. N1-3]|uniref:Uncharacterized protein n=1 Tax=Streptacidiphilus alkalitolerans TaxID=3342712 RepID=A0ABV6X763_9ACTN